MGRRREKDQHLPLRGKVYYYKAPGIYRRLSANWDEAYALYQELEGPINEAHTVGQALDRYLQTNLNSKAESTRREYTRYARAIRTAFGDQRLEALTSSDVAQYLRRRSAKVEANHEMAMPSSIYSEAMAQGWCDVNPCRGVRRNPEKPATIIPSATEIQKLKLAAAAQMRCMLEMELTTGARKDDLLAIRLADWSDARLLIVQSKTGQSVFYERTPELEALWKRCRALRRRVGSLYLFAGRLGQRYSTTGFDSNWQRLRTKAGIRAEVTFHSLRAYVITEAERLHGIDYARRIAGHKSVSTTARYVRSKEVIRVRPMTG